MISRTGPSCPGTPGASVSSFIICNVASIAAPSMFGYKVRKLEGYKVHEEPCNLLTLEPSAEFISAQMAVIYPVPQVGGACYPEVVVRALIHEASRAGTFAGVGGRFHNLFELLAGGRAKYASGAHLAVVYHQSEG